MKLLNANCRGKVLSYGGEPIRTATVVKRNQPMRGSKFRDSRRFDNRNIHFRLVPSSSCSVTRHVSLGSCMQHRKATFFLVPVDLGFGSFWFRCLMAESKRLIRVDDEGAGGSGGESGGGGGYGGGYGGGGEGFGGGGGVNGGGGGVGYGGGGCKCVVAGGFLKPQTL